MAPTSRRSNSMEESKQKKESPDNHKVSNRWVFLANDEIVVKDENVSPDVEPSICKLRHPRTDGCANFVVSCNGNLFELQCFDEKFHSWFIGDFIHSGGQIYITNPVDPLYLALPYLINAGKKERFMDLDQIICDEEFPSCDKIVPNLVQAQLALIADVKECGEDCYYRYNQAKTLNWLKAKVETVAEVLETKDIDVNTKGSHSAIFVQSKAAKASKDCYKRFGLGIVADYISVDLEEELKNFLGLEPEVEPTKTEDGEPPAKRAKTDSTDTGPTEDYSVGTDSKSKAQNVKLTAAQKRLSKVDKTGMKSISSFFAVKNK